MERTQMRSQKKMPFSVDMGPETLLISVVIALKNNAFAMPQGTKI